MIDTKSLPTHVGIILDGNRRWAKSQNMTSIDGHRRGLDVLKSISLHAFERGVKYLSAYIFSVENWRRTESEINYLMDLVVKAVEKYLNEYHERGIRIVILGRREGLRKKVLDAIVAAEEKTKNNTNGTLALCFNYGGMEEIADAAQVIVDNGEELSAENIAVALYHPEIPNLDIVIRTSGEQRLSGFMLARAAYSELYFTDKHWPEFTNSEFDSAINEYASRTRRHGI